MKKYFIDRPKKFGIYLALILFIFPATLWAEPKPNTRVSEFQLKNGLKLIVKEDHRAPVVLSSIWYKVGSSYEPRGITGISHALEHMMFRGTKKYGPGELARLINANGGDQNAITSDDFTFYYQTLPADQLELSFTLEADRMQNLSIEESAFLKEIQVVMEERRMRTEDNPQALTMERFNAIAFINNPYSHPVVGWMSDLQQMTVEDLRSWYHQWYIPNNAIIIVVGNVQPQQVYALAEKHFASIKPGNLISPRPTEEVSALGTRRIDVSIPAKLPQLIFGYNTPSLTKTAKNQQDPYVLMVLTYLLGGGESSRLTRDLVRGQQLAANASAYYSMYNLYSNLMCLTLTPSKQTSLATLENVLSNVLTQLQTQIVDATELQRAKALIIAGHVYDQDSLISQAISLALPEVNNLSWRLEDEFTQRIEAVTADQVLAAAKKYLVKTELTIGSLQPST